jgi:hypothetical protein
MSHGIPDPLDLTWLFRAIFVLAVVGMCLGAYYAFDECTRVHPVWYCLVR